MSEQLQRVYVARKIWDKDKGESVATPFNPMNDAIKLKLGLTAVLLPRTNPRNGLYDPIVAWDHHGEQYEASRTWLFLSTIIRKG